MTQPKYYSMEELVEMIDEPNRKAIKTFITEFRQTLQTKPGSTNNHQAWAGGWWDHITEVMNYAVLFYIADPRPKPFSLSDALLVLFMHDIEKPWKYEMRDGELHHRKDMGTKADHQAFRMEIARTWGINLTDIHVNGIKYAEGELDDYSPRHRVSSELAGFAHCCDHYSARVRHNYPLEKHDPWKGAFRKQKTSA